MKRRRKSALGGSAGMGPVTDVRGAAEVEEAVVELASSILQRAEAFEMGVVSE